MKPSFAPAGQPSVWVDLKAEPQITRPAVLRSKHCCLNLLLQVAGPRACVGGPGGGAADHKGQPARPQAGAPCKAALQRLLFGSLSKIIKRASPPDLKPVRARLPCKCMLSGLSEKKSSLVDLKPVRLAALQVSAFWLVKKSQPARPQAGAPGRLASVCLLWLIKPASLPDLAPVGWGWGCMLHALRVLLRAHAGLVRVAAFCRTLD